MFVVGDMLVVAEFILLQAVYTFFGMVPFNTDSDYVLKSFSKISAIVCNCTGWGKIKYPNTIIAISQKCLNIFSPNFAHLFGTILCTNVLPCASFTWHVKLMEMQTSRTNFTTEQKVDFIIKTRGQSNLTKRASWGAHSPVRGHPRGSKFVPLNSWGRVSY